MRILTKLFFYQFLLFILIANSYAKAESQLEQQLTKQLQSGDIIGISRLRGATALIIQSALRSPINHVAIAEKTELGVFIYELRAFPLSIIKISLSEFINYHSTQKGLLHYIVGRDSALTVSKFERMKSYLDKEVQLSLDGKIQNTSINCFLFVYEALKAAGNEKIEIIPNQLHAEMIFNGALSKATEALIKKTKFLLMPNHLFSIASHIVYSSGITSLNWDESEILRSWLSEGDFSLLVDLTNKFRTTHELNLNTADLIHLLSNNVSKATKQNLCQKGLTDQNLLNKNGLDLNN